MKSNGEARASMAAGPGYSIGHMAKWRALKGGEKFGDDAPITFYIGGIPSSSTDLKVGFADVPPIPVKPTQLK